MAEKGKEGKKKHVNKPTSKKYSHYASGKSTHKHCPKCGQGVFLAQHKDRQSCGKCGYTEFARK
ncbi:30S ribosomal protein S27ae [Candidatus Pacearchaeota archaeon]|nr:30S ribosomal protein S27ae [Candidatus Pacearchaeota archaeon]